MAENTGFDKTPTPPIDYDRNKIPESVKRRADYVRTKFTGEDVLEAIAQSGEIAGLIANEAHKKAEAVEGRQSEVEQLANQMIQETTDRDVISAPEIIQSRKGEVNLQTRLDKEHNEITAQLAQKANQISTSLSQYAARPIFDDFISSDNWTSRNQLGAIASDWIFENNKTRINTDAGTDQHFLWHKDKIQDGKIRVTWDNPKISATETISVAINFRAKDFLNYFGAYIYSGGSASGKVILYELVAGAYSTLANITLTGGDVTILDGVPLSFEVAFYGDKCDVLVNGKRVIEKRVLARKFNSGMFGFQIPASNASTSNLSTTLSNFSAEERLYTSYSKDVNEILIVGDSIAYEQGSTPGMGWIDLFENKAKLLNKDLKITNVAVPGANSLSVFNQIAAAIGANPQKYDMVIISCGTNNTRYDGTSRRTVLETQFDLIGMIKIAKNYNIIPVLCTPPNYTNDVATLFPANYNSTSYALLAQIANAIRKVANAENVRLVDNYPLLNNDFTKLGDGVHPNNAGYALMGENLYKVVFND